MRLHLMMLLGAIGLSCVAAYYSIIGMTSIFTGEVIPIIIMTGFLETNKLILASWLYNNWLVTRFALKFYYTGAVVVLMLVTSMGIFGFLSKANVEQAALAEEQQAQIQRVQQQITEQTDIITQAKQKIANLGTDSTAGDVAVNARIAEANKIIDSATLQVQPQIDEQQHIIDQERSKIELRVKTVQTQIDDIDKQVADLDSIVKGWVDQGKTRQAQQKQAQQKPIRDGLATQKSALLKQIDTIRNAPDSTVDAAKAEIAKIRAKVDADTKQAHDVINSMTAQLGKAVDTDKVQAEADQLNQRIKAASDQVDQFTATKFKLEGESRKLEVEVGPIKYIAQMFYGDDVDTKLLAHAVRWVILTLIFVFDPLAVLMLIGANQGFAQHRKELEDRALAAKEVELQHRNVSIVFEEETYTSEPEDSIVIDVEEPQNNVEATEVADLNTNIVEETEPLIIDDAPETTTLEDKFETLEEEQLTTEAEPVTVQDDESNKEDPQLELTFDTLYDDRAFEVVYEEPVDEPMLNDADDIVHHLLGPVLSTEDLLTTLKRAHSARMGKLVVKKLDNQET